MAKEAHETARPHPFKDRTEAGERLAARLLPLLARPCVIAAVPRGGVAVAVPIVERLERLLTIVHACKLTAPAAPELAFGALDEDGQAIIDRETVARLQLSVQDIESAKAKVETEIRRRRGLYKARPLAQCLPGPDVVLVDDGLATGLTMRAAIAYARRHGAREVTVAVPCASEAAAACLREEVDRFVSLIVGDAFGAVGGYYADFAKLTDEDMSATIARVEAGPSELPISFGNARGTKLVGQLVLPAFQGRAPVVVFAHGWDSGKHSPHNRMIARTLAEHGIASFLFDFSGHGESEGRREDCTLARQCEDLAAALDVLASRDEVDRRRLGMVGVSTSAACALLTAARNPHVRALVLWSSTLVGVDEAMPSVMTPTLLVLGEGDAPIHARNEQLLARLSGPCRLETIPSDLFEDDDAIVRASRLMAEWFKTYLM